MQKLPLAKTQNIVVQEFGREVLIYDLITNQACSLNETAAVVYRACDGKTSVADLMKKYPIGEELIHFSLKQLSKENLLEDAPTNYFGNLTRREVIRKVGLTSMMALPIISTVVAPTAVSASSCASFLQPCTFNNFTQSDCCDSTLRCSDSTVPNVCRNCFGSGSPFASAPGFATPAFCATQASKNLCCDNVSLVTGDGNNCFCP